MSCKTRYFWGYRANAGAQPMYQEKVRNNAKMVNPAYVELCFRKRQDANYPY